VKIHIESIFECSFQSTDLEFVKASRGLNKTPGKVVTVTSLSDVCYIKNVLRERDDLSPLLFNITLEYTMQKVEKKGGIESECDTWMLRGRFSK
jgi:hypothetical protein